MTVSTLVMVLLSLALSLNNTVVHSPKVLNFLTNYQNQITSTSDSHHKQTITSNEINLYIPTAESSISNSKLSTVNAQSYEVYDIVSGSVMVAHEADQRRPIASLTKLMTALVILHDHSADEVVVIPELPRLTSDIAIAGLKTGDQYKVRDLIGAMLVSSSADAAQSLAIWDAHTEAQFVSKMNDSAAYWGMTNTKFANEIGLDDTNNYSTANDLIRLVSLLIQNRTINQFVAQPTISITNQSGEHKRLSSTNQLLGRNIIGVKTGTTLAAGECFIGHYSDTERNLITVILGSNDRFAETQKMLNYTFKSINWI